MKENKLKKDKRDYNVFLHTHTVSGIVISIGLFVCFFAGAFALFREEIDYWQYNKKLPESYNTSLDYEKVIRAIEDDGYSLDHRSFNVRLFHKAPKEYLFVNVQAIDTSNAILKEQVSVDSLNAVSKKKVGEFYSLIVNPDTYEVREWKRFQEERLLGEFIYRLHFFDQIPVVGIWIAGFVALFFLFAILTGLVVHWKKVKSNFFTFRPKASLKVLWTDGHTALGVIGLPFQFMYAVTGCIYGMSLLLLIPTVTLLYNGDQEELFSDLLPGQKQYDVQEGTTHSRVNINDLSKTFFSQQKFEGEIENASLQIQNYGNKNAVANFQVNIDDDNRFFASASTTFHLATGKQISVKNLDDMHYAERVFSASGKLHFASFGGYFVRVIYFILAILTCYVIISGVMIWLNARQSKKYEHKKKFIRNVGTIYLGICMGLFPAIALAFILLKILAVNDMPLGGGYALFGLFWLAYTVYAAILKDYKKVTRRALGLGVVFGFFIPVVNGIFGEMWIWDAIASRTDAVILVDMSWIGISIITGLYLWNSRATKKKENESAPTN